MSANDELFVRVLAQIEREPQRWEQRRFWTQRECGTAFCFAGWACVFDGITYDADNYIFCTDDGTPVDPAAHAQRLLGIGGWWYTDVDHLFDPDNTLDDLYRISAGHMGIDGTVLRDKVAAAVAGGHA